jgi:hypothetical protein
VRKRPAVAARCDCERVAVYCSQTIASRSRLVGVGGGNGNPLSLRGRRKPPPLPGHRGVEGGGLGRSNKIRIPWQPSPAQPAEGLACSCSAPTSETFQTGSRAAPCFPACPTDRRVGGPTLSVTYHITRRAAGFLFCFRNPPPRPPKPTPLNLKHFAASSSIFFNFSHPPPSTQSPSYIKYLCSFGRWRVPVCSERKSTAA